MKNNILKKLVAILILALILSIVSGVGIFALAETTAEDSDDSMIDNDGWLLNSYIGYADNENEGTEPKGLFEPEYDWDFSSVRTPNGSPILTAVVRKDFTALGKQLLANRWTKRYPNAILLASATKFYNCHSYAWYNQNSTENHFWMDNPSKYYDVSDKSYERVYQPRVGDIVSYFNMNAPTSEQNIHSGIIVQVLQGESNGVCGDANLIMVESKWGKLPLFRHRGDECPYTSNNGGTATEIRYYRPRTNTEYYLSTEMSNVDRSVYLSGNGINNQYVMYELNIFSNYSYNFQISAASALDIRLYNKHMNLIYSESDKTSISVKKSLNKSEGIYYLRLAFKDTSHAGSISLKIEGPHSHYYGEYEWIDGKQHYAQCTSCGVKVAQPHAVEAGASTSPLKRKTCIMCGGTVDYGFVKYESLQPVIECSNNGSYILPNGVIVLVSDDVSSYLNGTLVFNEVVPMSTIAYQYSTISRLSQMQ